MWACRSTLLWWSLPGSGWNSYKLCNSWGENPTSVCIILTITIVYYSTCLLVIGHTFCSSLIKSDQHQMSDAGTVAHHAACYLYYTSQLYLIHLIFVVCWSWVFSNGFGHSLSVSTFIYFNKKWAVANGLLNICVKYVEFLQKLTKTYKEVKAIQVIYCKLIVDLEFHKF